MIRQFGGALLVLAGLALLLGFWTLVPGCLVTIPATWITPSYCAVPNPFFFLNQLIGLIALIGGLVLALTGRRKGRK